MNKTAIKNFAIWARNKLIADICYRAGLMGITEKGIADPLPQSTLDAQFYDIGAAEPYLVAGEAIKQPPDRGAVHGGQRLSALPPAGAFLRERQGGAGSGHHPL